MAEPRRTSEGPGRILVAVYAVFALAATARSAVQLATRFGQAPLPYLLSAVAGAIYIVATVALSRGSGGARWVAWAACWIELLGVLSVGTASALAPGAFSDDTVWSFFGQGYGYVPVVLPVLGLGWLWRTSAGRRPIGSACS